MNSFDFELWIEQYKAIIKKTGERSLFPDEMTRLDNNIEDYMPEEYTDAYNRARGGDYSKFETLPHLLRNYLGAKALKEFRDEFGEIPSLDDERVRQYLEKNAMNAALRAGISAEKNAIPHRGDSAEENEAPYKKIITEKDAEETRKYAAALDSYMNGILMKRTMQPVTPEGRERLVADLGGSERADAAIEKNAAKQLVMAKMMLLAQIGKYEVIGKNGLSKELDVPVYETLVHGNRTNFVLPAGEDSSRVIDAFMGQNGGAGAGIEERTAATHSVKRRKFGKGGELKSDSKEQRTYSPLKVFGHQYGMDIAVGGLGENGPGGENDHILGDGESGHMYMRAEAGDSKYCGSLLIGIEGSAPGKDSYLGNSHGIRAKSAKQSAFLADKSIVGKKIGGRQVDLSGITSEELTKLLNEFSDKYSALQQNASTNEGRDKLAKVNDMLMGKPMDINKIKDMFASLGMTDQGLGDIVSQARGGYLSKIDPKKISRDEFAQSIRAQFSQEQACDIAKARFEYAGIDLKLAAGAIKELICTHETRSRGWRLLHPIKNYREKAMISSLTAKLKTGRGFEPAQIASAFSYSDDTFSLDWGDALSYNREVVGFHKANRDAFKPSDNKLSGALRKVYKDLGIEPPSYEEKVAQVQKELATVLKNRNLENEKEKLSIKEEDELIKQGNLEMSENIIQEQPTITNQRKM